MIKTNITPKTKKGITLKYSPGDGVSFDPSFTNPKTSKLSRAFAGAIMARTTHGLYVAGGRAGGIIHRDVGDYYDEVIQGGDSGYWSLAQYGYYLQYSIFRSYIYTIGGRHNTESTTYKGVYRYDTATRTTTYGTESPGNSYGTRSCPITEGSFGIKLFYMPWYTGLIRHTRYEMDSHVTLQTRLPESRGGYILVNSRHDIFILGGYFSGSYLNSCYKYNAITGVLTSISPIPEALGAYGAEVLGAYIYIFCGNTQTGRSNRIYRYSILEDMWERVAKDYPLTLSDVNVAADYDKGKNKHIIITGGGTADGSNNVSTHYEWHMKGTQPYSDITIDGEGKVTTGGVTYELPQPALKVTNNEVKIEENTKISRIKVNRY